MASGISELHDDHEGGHKSSKSEWQADYHVPEPVLYFTAYSACKTVRLFFSVHKTGKHDKQSELEIGTISSEM